MKFEHDIFISYAAATGAENKATTEWTLKFCEYLSILMSRLYDKKPVIMLHDDLRVRQSMLGESTRQVLSGTAVAVLILSPEFAHSASYLAEIEDIYNTINPDGNESGKKHRIFTVLMQPVASDEQPACLKSELNYNFFDINRYNKKPITFDLSGKNGPGTKFWSKLVDLAYDIADTLAELNGDRIENGPVKERPGVFLADTTFDQTENLDMLKRELQHLGFRVLPKIQIPDNAELAKAIINESLEQSIMAVHLLGAWYGDFMKNSKYSFIDFQIKTVKDFITGKNKQPTLNQIIWIPSDIKPTDQRQALYLKRLKEMKHNTALKSLKLPSRYSRRS